MGTILLYGTNLAVNLRLNMGSILLDGTNLAVNLRLNMGTVLLYGTNLAVNLRLNFLFYNKHFFQTVLSANFFSIL